MCNLYSQKLDPGRLMADFFASERRGENRPWDSEIYPDRFAPVVLQRPEGRTVEMMRWGLPPPPKAPGGGRPVTNVRNLASPHWRAWLKPEWRCLVPATAFSEYTDSSPKVLHWFAQDGMRTPFAFAGIWRPWTGLRGTKANPEDGDHLLFAFLTCPANGVVAPIHSKAMPVVLTTREEQEAWLAAPIEQVPAMQRPLDDRLLRIVSVGTKADPGGA